MTALAPLKADSFCSLDQAEAQMLRAAEISVDGIYKDLEGKRSKEYISGIVNRIAATIVKRKLVAGKGEKLEITWEDIYNMRGTVGAWGCQEGLRMYCVSSFIDAIGSGMEGTFLGRQITEAGLALAGPPGYVLLNGKKITQQAFQCNPDTVAMALDAGESLLLMLPFCEIGIGQRLCVKPGEMGGQQVMKLMARYAKKDFAIGVAKVMHTESGGKLAVVMADMINKSVTDAAAHAVNGAAYSVLTNDFAVPAPPPTPTVTGEDLYDPGL